MKISTTTKPPTPKKKTKKKKDKYFFPEVLYETHSNTIIKTKHVIWLILFDPYFSSLQMVRYGVYADGQGPCHIYPLHKYFNKKMFK